jgi:hypothetical protein
MSSLKLNILRLCQLLRYVTYEGWNWLYMEINFIEDYIAPKDLKIPYFRYNAWRGYGRQPVPSLVFIHFVENIFLNVGCHQCISAKIKSIIVAEEFINLWKRLI